MTKRAILALEDGTVFKGLSIGISGRAVGEVVFNTAMSGYQEILTDPSYFRQLVTLTYPHIGNVGTNSSDFESTKAYAAGLVVRDLSLQVSNYRSENSLPEFLKRYKMVAIAEIDTRKLTRLIRKKGAQGGCIIAGTNPDPEDAIREAQRFPGLKGMDLARLVTTKKSYRWSEGTSWETSDLITDKNQGMLHVVAYDFGIKHNILRLLSDGGCLVTVVPAMTAANEVMELAPDGVFLSNGPGDPEPCSYAIDAIKALMVKGIPVFGICLGHQLLALACGAKTMKMKFGHHGANHPVLELDTGRVLITSQNHGFAVDGEHLPEHLGATHHSLFDGSLQGIEHKEKPAFSFQGHPEASPGPHDLRPLFTRFFAAMRVGAQSVPEIGNKII